MKGGSLNMIVNEMAFKNGTIKIAEQLMYPKEIISQIKSNKQLKFRAS